MTSTSAMRRRRPQQERAALRRAKFLEVAATLFGKLGYEGVTMTAIAEHAQASIGALYDYFPDKVSVALALLAQYTAESDAYWSALLHDLPAETSLGDLFVEGILDFVRERPAYLPLLGSPLAYSRSAAARQPLRKTIAGVLETMNPKLSAERAFTSAQIVVELMKGLLAVYKQSAAKDRDAITEEFRALMKFYLRTTLRPGRQVLPRVL